MKRSKTVLFLSVLALVAFSTSAQSQNLLTNGDFESATTGWTEWNAPPTGFWNDTWIRANDCDIWVPTNGCPYDGSISFSQKKGSGSGNAHGGILQTISVTAGRTYNISGFWSGGVQANLDADNGSWWEVLVFDGVPTDASIDIGLGPNDVEIAKREISNMASNEVFQFQWEPFSGSFTAPSDTVTVVLKSGSFYTLAAAAYFDNLTVSPVAVPVSVPATSGVNLAFLALMLLAVGFMFRLRAIQ